MISHDGQHHLRAAAIVLLILLFVCSNSHFSAQAFQLQLRDVGFLRGVENKCALLNHNLIETRQIRSENIGRNEGRIRTRSATKLGSASSAIEEGNREEEQQGSAGKADPKAPQVFATGYSNDPDLHTALQQAVNSALAALPAPDPDAPSDGVGIDLAFVTASSLYNASPATIVPAVLGMASVYGSGIDKLVGCTSGGMISSVVKASDGDGADSAAGVSQRGRDSSGNSEDAAAVRECIPLETEGILGVSVTLALLPDVKVSTFHVLSDDVPDDVGRITSREWNNAVGLTGYAGTDDERAEVPVFLLLPSPGFQSDLGELLHGLSVHHPNASIIGGIASTVSSLSRAQLFRYDAAEPNAQNILGDGLVGVVMNGDIQVETMLAQGAKPVGGIYRVVSGQESTIGAIMLDEEATKEDDDAADALAGEEEEDDSEGEMDAKAMARAAYSKAAIPKPVLAEANYLMKALGDEEQSFMRKTILVGLERGGVVGRTPNELARLAEGEGHRFAVHQVASAGMKDGSVTLPLGSVNVEKGTRFRFFVREGDFARKEVDALWTGYKKSSLASTFDGGEALPSPSACMILSTIDRGSKLFGGKPGLESGKVSEYLPMVPSIFGLKANGVLGKLDGNASGNVDTMVHGSAASYVIFRSKSNRPVYSTRQVESNAAKKSAERREESDDDISELPSRSLAAFDPTNEAAPRDEDGELVLRRREVHSGRAISVSTVEWSVADKMAKPTSALEGAMWDKETEVDRFRERVPLSNLVSQCKLYNLDPSKPKPRDFIGQLKHAAQDGAFVIIPECKRTEPTLGSLRRRYDVAKLVKGLTIAGAPALCVNCDPVVFGGSLEDITTAREAANKAAAEGVSSDYSFDEGIVVPPIIASDLILYPYQLYKLRLAGADAVRLVAAALESKDLLYLTKIAQSLKMQAILSVASEKQITSITSLSPGSISAVVVSNRELEDFSFDETGEKALSLLCSDSLKEFLAVHDVPVFVEGRVGIISREDERGNESAANYIKELKEAGAFGAFVGGGLADRNKDNVNDSWKALIHDTELAAR
mmetsp:Transcript_20918/g.45604  ORF Transcript_20918/g.45604 Transcript_20918/m.45604 type:complete len:1053 (+) Transcript_20918:262-3420(+)|eukprot:CAMPEP_0178494842 /NCGR_PEP_ID=MMETSP0696-20121128/13227_1 /TAXON_ID=265572 /ORGANISM="Extubocellulus spinifer, Strain CCMP396" /LENGTH=1052 /DNA_ID=CAMNT_0020122941 /DNA_START=246 /DNA_END=3404 /DNA_ORIENTATION=+